MKFSLVYHFWLSHSLAYIYNCVYLSYFKDKFLRVDFLKYLKNSKYSFILFFEVYRVTKNIITIHTWINSVKVCTSSSISRAITVKNLSVCQKKLYYLNLHVFIKLRFDIFIFTCILSITF